VCGISLRGALLRVIRLLAIVHGDLTVRSAYISNLVPPYHGKNAVPVEIADPGGI